MNRAWLSSLVLALCLPAAAQTALPPAPEPQHDYIRPFSFNVSAFNREQLIPYQGFQNETTVSFGADWRFPDNKIRIGMSFGRALGSGKETLTTMITYKLFEAGRRR